MQTKAAMSARVVLAAFAYLFLVTGTALAQSAPAGKRSHEVLSVGWQPGYCAARPRSRGCAGFSETSAAARRFSLLNRFQPGKSYCGIDAALKQKARKGKWTDLPGITLASGTRERLSAALPVASLGLDRRQWLRSGICIAASADAFYSRSLDLLDQLNASSVPALFIKKEGATVTLAEVRSAFDAAFGPGAGERVRLSCRKAGGKTVVTGLTIGLATGEGTLARLITDAPATVSRCTEGVTGAIESVQVSRRR